MRLTSSASTLARVVGRRRPSLRARVTPQTRHTPSKCVDNPRFETGEGAPDITLFVVSPQPGICAHIPCLVQADSLPPPSRAPPPGPPAATSRLSLCARPSYTMRRLTDSSHLEYS